MVLKSSRPAKLEQLKPLAQTETDLEAKPEMQCRMRESGEAIAGLKLVHRRLSMELERRQASPSQRLLDELLEVMAPVEGVEPFEQEEVRNRPFQACSVWHLATRRRRTNFHKQGRQV